MINEAVISSDLERLANQDLAQEIEDRAKIFQKWDEIYRKEFIPFAHGVRLFGQVYNDIMKPKDPFEFVELLARRRNVKPAEKCHDGRNGCQNKRDFRSARKLALEQ
jgi:hypothetical protein